LGFAYFSLSKLCNKIWYFRISQMSCLLLSIGVGFACLSTFGKIYSQKSILWGTKYSTRVGFSLLQIAKKFSPKQKIQKNLRCNFIFSSQDNKIYGDYIIIFNIELGFFEYMKESLDYKTKTGKFGIFFLQTNRK